MLERLSRKDMAIIFIVALIVSWLFTFGPAAQNIYQAGYESGKSVTSEAVYKDGYQKGYASAYYELA